MSDIAKQNVVSLEDYAQITRGMGSGACAQALRAVRTLAEKRLARNMSNVMGKIDDALFGRAEMAESITLQVQYHNAMQALRDIRRHVEEDFINRFNNQFNQGIPRQAQFGDSFMLECDAATSATVSPDSSHSEENRAIANMVDKTREDCTQLLFALDRRIGFLTQDTDLEQWQNPLGPEAICAAFQGAAKAIETGVEIRLMIFKLFDQHVISNVNELYKELNHYLVKMGVMPDIKATLHSNASPADGPQAPTTPLTGQAGTSAPAPAGQQAGAGRQASAQSGDMTIDIVAMLFDYILDDRNIPVPMRALLGRLQIPLVKVAMREREFFSKKSHPARQLLNALAATAMGWEAQQGDEDPSYRKVEAIVQTIVNEFESDTSLFKTLLDDLESFHDAEQQQARIRAERSVKLMQGQERLDSAKSTALQEIEPRISDQKNLEFVHEFITTHWKNLLFITCARQGKDSDAWQQAVSTMDDLLWSVKPKNTDLEQQRLVAMQPKLLNDLREGMERLSVPQAELDAFTARLIDAHGHTPTSDEDTEQAAETQEHTAARDDLAASQQIETGEGTPRIAAEAAELDEAPALVVTRKIPKAGRRPKMVRRKKSPSGQVDDLYTSKVRHLTIGNWVEFLASDGKATRAKLSWVSPINNTYLFTDQQGLKAGSYTLEELAKLMRCARANILNAAPLMDRAISRALEDYQKP